MSNQLHLRGFTKRLIGDFYIGRITVEDLPEDNPRREWPVPTYYPRHSMSYVRDPEIESFETLSISSAESNNSKPTSLEYRITGITWYTPNYENTCSIDSFLSAWVRKMRQTHGKYLKHVQVEDRTANALFEIADHALRAKEKINAEQVKGLWIIAVLRRSNELDAFRSLPIDCTGQNTYSVFQALNFHNSFEIVSSCNCGTFYHTDFILEVPDLNQVEILGNPKRLNEAEMPKCLNCNKKRTLLELNPMKTNWLLTFNYNGTKEKRNLSPNFDEIPKIVQMGNITFKLEYIAYCQDIPNHPDLFHEVSMQFIRHKWYLYDGCRSPKFRRWGGKKYAQYNAVLTTIVYFKI